MAAPVRALPKAVPRISGYLAVPLLVFLTATGVALACVGAAEPTTLTTSLSGESKSGESITVLEGSKVKDQATLEGENAAEATGKISYAVYKDSSCEELVTEAGEFEFGEGEVPASEEKTLEAGKVYYWQAHYGGDSLDAESTSACGEEVLSVKAATSLSTSLSGEGESGETITVLEGSKVKDKATLSGTNHATATGKVAYKVYKDSECKELATEAGEVSLSGGEAPASEEKTLTGGAVYYWQAHYEGDSLHQASTSSCTEIATIKAAMTLSTSLSGETGVDEEPVEGKEITIAEGFAMADTATLSGTSAAEATGTVEYFVYSDPECEELVAEAGEGNVEGGEVPPSEEENLEEGTYYWQAVYSGDALHAGTTSSCAEIATVLAPTSLATSLSGEGSEGEEIEVSEEAVVTDSATLSGTKASEATGTVKYFVYSDPECEELVAEAGEVSVAGETVPSSSGETLESGLYYWQAVYSGDGLNHSSATACGSEVEVVMPPITTTLTGGEASGGEIEVVDGTSVSDEATLYGEHAAEATGSVEYFVYSDSECEELVAEAGKAKVEGASVPASSAVELEETGTYYWQAEYSGDEKNPKATSACGTEVSVATTPTSLTTTLSGGGEEGAEIEVEEGAAVSDVATLSGADAASAEGTVTYMVYADGSCTEVAGVGGVATVEGGSVGVSSEATLPPGTYYWQAEYSGDGVNHGSKGACGSEIEVVTTPITMSLSGEGLSGNEIEVGEETPVTGDATLHGEHAAEATGTVKYFVYSDSECEKLTAEAGEVEVEGAEVPPSEEVALEEKGIYYWQAVYSGDEKNPEATSACQATQEIVWNPATYQYAALGDSFSSGQGAVATGGKYYKETNIGAEPKVHGKNVCHRAATAWPALIWESAFKEPVLGVAQVTPPVVLQQSPRFIFRACSGAVGTNIWSGGPKANTDGQWDEWNGTTKGWIPTPAQTRWLTTTKVGPPKVAIPNANIALVTLTIGGNDAGFAKIAEKCFTRAAKIVPRARPYDPVPCQKTIEDWEGTGFAAITARLPILLPEIAKQAPNAKIEIPLYPRMLNLKVKEIPLTDNGKLIINNVVRDKGKRKVTAAQSLADFIIKLNDTISKAVSKAGVAKAAVVPETVGAFDGIFGNHRLGDVSPWVNGLILPFHTEESLHPTVCGHKAFAILARRMVPATRPIVPCK